MDGRCEGAIYWLNNRWYEYTGRPAGEVGPHGWQTILGLAGIEALHVGAALEAEIFVLLGKDGAVSSFPDPHRFVPRFVRDIYGWIGTHIDISERKRMSRRYTGQRTRPKPRCGICGKPRIR